MGNSRDERLQAPIFILPLTAIELARQTIFNANPITLLHFCPHPSVMLHLFEWRNG
jgi:hypothetical protein